MVSGLGYAPMERAGKDAGQRTTEKRRGVDLSHLPPWTGQAPCAQTATPQPSSHLTPLLWEHRQVISLDRMRPRIFPLTHTSIQDEVNNDTNSSCRLLSTYYMPGPVLKAFYKHSPTNPHQTLLAGNEDAYLGTRKRRSRRARCLPQLAEQRQGFTRPDCHALLAHGCELMFCFHFHHQLKWHFVGRAGCGVSRGSLKHREGGREYANKATGRVCLERDRQGVTCGGQGSRQYNTRVADGYRIEPGGWGGGYSRLMEAYGRGSALRTGKTEKQREARDAP